MAIYSPFAGVSLVPARAAHARARVRPACDRVRRAFRASFRAAWRLLTPSRRALRNAR
jgi:hypothetical protein